MPRRLFVAKRDCVVGIVTRLWAGRSGVRIAAGLGARDILFSSQSSVPAPGTHPVSFMRTVIPITIKHI